ncbi:WASH complex, subunit strumpellin, partial [Kipferlia bialata]|eukprot:g13264.t1
MEESKRSANFHAEQECNRYFTKPVYPWASQHQSRDAPIPNPKALPPSDARLLVPTLEANAPTYIGKLTNALLCITDPCVALYSPSLGTWFSRN